MSNEPRKTIDLMAALKSSLAKTQAEIDAKKAHRERGDPMSNERAATHAPKTELPTLTKAHVDVLNKYFEGMFPDDAPEYRAIRVNIEAQVSGEAKLVPTATHRAVSVEEMEVVIEDLETGESMSALRQVRRWLTPEDERHE